MDPIAAPYSFSLPACADAALACTMTLELPVGAQSLCAAERPMGSVVKIEVDGKPLSEDTPPHVPLSILKPALLTLTF
jgi:hypothetical protein